MLGILEPHRYGQDTRHESCRQSQRSFDFSDVGIGPYSLDFAELFHLDTDICTIDAELARLTAEAYATMNNVPSPLLGGAADYIVRRAIFMLEARKKNDSEAEINWLKALSDFLPVWQQVVNRTGSISI